DRADRTQDRSPRRPRSARGPRRLSRRVGAVHRPGHLVWPRGQQPEGVLHHAAQRDHRRGAVLRRGQRLHADLRPHARGEHGPRGVLPPRRLHRAAPPARHGRRRRGVRRLERPGRPGAVGAAAPGRRGGRGRRRPAHAATAAALEPGAGPAPGAHHDRHLDHPGRPDARGVRRRRVGHHVARDVRQVRRLPGRRRAVHADAAHHPGHRPGDRRRAVVLAQAHADGDGHPRGRRRPRHGLRDGDQHPADVRHRVRRRLRPGGRRRRHRRLVREPRARRGRQLAPELARGRDHRRDGLPGRRGDRRAPARADHDLRVGVPAVRLHLLLDHLHLRPAGDRPRGPPARPLRASRV
ncbi:MAG: High-affinity branched-chain amino acid transport system permease protein LivH, partial [uncultured Solirubrobacteraceae bacterium]